MNRIIHLDTNHPILWKRLQEMGFENEADYSTSYEGLKEKLSQVEGIIIRSRVPLDRGLLEHAKQLKFIGRVGAGLENIDTYYCEERGIKLIAAPEGNRNAVGEHALGMLLSLLNKLNKADAEVRKGIWNREENRGQELDGKTVGIIGYGNTGRTFAKKLRGFEVEVLCNDILSEVGDRYAKQVSLEELQQRADIISLHVPESPVTLRMINHEFIDNCLNNFWLLNTARGKCVDTGALVEAIKQGKIMGAGLDVLEYEKRSFEKLSGDEKIPEALSYLMSSDKVLLTPHIAGWTVESRQKLAEVVAEKISYLYRR